MTDARQAACESADVPEGALQSACGRVFVQRVVTSTASASGVRVSPSTTQTGITREHLSLPLRQGEMASVSLVGGGEKTLRLPGEKRRPGDPSSAGSLRVGGGPWRARRAPPRGQIPPNSKTVFLCCLKSPSEMWRVTGPDHRGTACLLQEQRNKPVGF